MNLYKIERKDAGGYVTYDMAVVAAKDDFEARCISPDGWSMWDKIKGWVRISSGEPVGYSSGSWTSLDNITVTKVGRAIPGTERGVIVASFNAG